MTREEDKRNGDTRNQNSRNGGRQKVSGRNDNSCGEDKPATMDALTESGDRQIVGRPAIRGKEANRNEEGMIRQRTLRSGFSFSGIGLHSGKSGLVSLYPAPVDTGVCFIIYGRPVLINPSLVHRQSPRSTTISAAGSSRIGTLEHLLAALSGLGIDNVVIEVQGQEIPIRDGSARDFVALLNGAGITEQRAPRKYLQVLLPVEHREDGGSIAILPSDHLEIDAEIIFDHSCISRQRYYYRADSDAFQKEIAPARTFGFLADLPFLQAQGLALGARYDNVIALDDTAVLNPEGLRFADEFVRHKVLDLIGDLCLLGTPLLGRIISRCGSHRLNNMLLRRLLDQTEHVDWRYVHKTVSGRVLPADAATRSLAS